MCIRDSPRIVKLLRKVNLYILPMVDVEGFAPDLVGECTYDDGRGTRKMSYEVGSKFVSRPTNPPEIKAVKQFLANYNIQVGLSLEGEGVFMRMPWDERHKHDSKDDQSLRFLAEAYFKAHPVMSNVSAAADALCKPIRNHESSYPVSVNVPERGPFFWA